MKTLIQSTKHTPLQTYPKPQEAFPDLSRAINEESYAWLSENFPALCVALRKEVENGASPEEIKTFIVAQTGREALALRLKQAAAYLQSLKATQNS